MPIQICKITKCGTQYFNTIEKYISSEKNISIVAVREPFQRFWSSVKETHPFLKISRKGLPENRMIYGIPFPAANVLIDDVISFLTKGNTYCHPMLETYFNHDHFIDQAIFHLKPQNSFILTQKFDYVFKTENLSEEFENLVEKNIISTTKPIKEIPRQNVSQTYYDEEAMDYIKSNCSSFIEEYYAKDFEYYYNPNLLLKSYS